MIRIVITLTAATLLLSACAPAALVYAESRNVSRVAIVPLMAELAPGKEAGAAADCAIKGMTYGEVLALPNTNALKDPADLRARLVPILARPAAQECLAAVPTVSP